MSRKISSGTATSKIPRGLLSSLKNHQIPMIASAISTAMMNIGIIIFEMTTLLSLPQRGQTNSAFLLLK